MRALIVDDERPARARLRRLLALHPEISIVGEASDGLQALEEIAKLRPDLVFLDLSMPGLDGFGVANSLESNGPAIVFVTAHDQHALKAFDANAIDYLVKPVEKDRLAQTLAKLRKLTRGPKSTTPASSQFAVLSGSRYVICDPKKVSAVLSKDHYSLIIMEQQELVVDGSLNSLLKRFASVSFVRVHRNAVINLEFLSTLERKSERQYTALLSDKKSTRVPVSRARLAQLRTKLKIV